MNSIKEELYKLCQTWVQERIRNANSAMEEAQAAANDETKSSAGDKHETARAMAQQEREKAANQLAEALKLEQVLQKINPKQTDTTATLGSLITTNKGNYYLSIGAGKLIVDSNTYFAISLASPIGQVLANKKARDSFDFNNNSYEIILVH